MLFCGVFDRLEKHPDVSSRKKRKKVLDGAEAFGELAILEEPVMILLVLCPPRYEGCVFAGVYSVLVHVPLSGNMEGKA